LPGETFLRKSVHNSFLKLSDKKKKRKSGYISIEDEEDRLINTPNAFCTRNSPDRQDSQSSKDQSGPAKDNSA